MKWHIFVYLVFHTKDGSVIKYMFLAIYFTWCILPLQLEKPPNIWANCLWSNLQACWPLPSQRSYVILVEFDKFRIWDGQACLVGHPVPLDILCLQTGVRITFSFLEIRNAIWYYYQGECNQYQNGSFLLASKDVRASARDTRGSQGGEGDGNQKVAPPGNQTTWI